MAWRCMSHLARSPRLCSQNDDNLQLLRADENLAKSNRLPAVPELAELRDVWPTHWGDVLPAAIACPPAYAHLRRARPLEAQTFLSKRPRHAAYDEEWVDGLCKLFKIQRA